MEPTVPTLTKEATGEPVTFLVCFSTHRFGGHRGKAEYVNPTHLISLNNTGNCVLPSTRFHSQPQIS